MYEVLEHRNVIKELRHVPNEVSNDYNNLKERLKTDPRSCIDKQLQGFKEPTYSYRIGDYRVIFCIDDGKVMVFVISLAHRKKVYKRK